ncbi:MAG: hypothetical protein ACFE9L_01590 [Candidatus Hodarchaeota archaeon]
MTKCQNKVKDQESKGKIFFCIALKEYIPSCPKKCPFYVKGSNLSMNIIYQKNFEMECPYFLLMTAISSQDSKSFICSIFGEEFQCEYCPVNTRVLDENKYSSEIP